MAFLLGKANDFVFYAGAVARAFGLHPAAVDGGEMEVVADELDEFQQWCASCGKEFAHARSTTYGVEAEPADVCDRRAGVASLL